MYCSHCGNELNDDNSVLCPFCGEKVFRPSIDTEPPEKAYYKKWLTILRVVSVIVVMVFILLIHQIITLNRQLLDFKAKESTSTGEKAEEQTEETDTSINGLITVNTITPETAVGDYVQFGTYEQDNKPENGKEPIEWLVLEDDGDRYLMITSKVIDAACYNNVWMETDWKNSSLREWLNKSFLEEAFTEQQQSSITKWHSSLSDKIFILSRKELNKYLPSAEERIAKATHYAEAQGVYTQNIGTSWWWVREAGATPYYAVYVNCIGDIINDGSIVFNNAFGVRPVIWVRK